MSWGRRPASGEFDDEVRAPSIAIGSVDDAYADRLRPGDRLLLSGRCLVYRGRERGAVLVDEANTRPIVPRWSGSACSLTRALAERLFLFRAQASEVLRDGREAFHQWLDGDYGMDDSASAVLADYFLSQETISEIPDAGTLLVEATTDDLGFTYYVHTALNRAGNDGLARVAAQRLQHRCGTDTVTVAADLGFVLMPSGIPIDAQAWRGLLAERDFDADLAQAIGESGSLRERFAGVATTGLMVLRQPVGGRRKVGGHDWAERRLFDQVRHSDPRFVLLRQAEREVMMDVCDGGAAREYVAQMPMRQVRCRRTRQVSPFAASWAPTGDAGEGAGAAPLEALARLHTELVGA